MRHVVEQSAVEHREVDDPLDAGFARQIERQERLGHLAGSRGIEQEQLVDALQRRTHRDDVSHVSLHRLDTRRRLELRCVECERTDLGAFVGELLHDLRPNCACAACYENRHRLYPSVQPPIAVAAS